MRRRLAKLTMGRAEEAVRGWEKAVALSERKVHFILSALGYGYAMEGNEEEALEIASELEGWSDRNIHTASNRALVYSGLGNLDRAFELLEEAYQNREFLVLELMLNPGVEPLRRDPRFEDILRRMGLERPQAAGDSPR